MKLPQLKSELKNTLFLSFMMRKTDGKFCAKCGQGARMVQLGAYIAARKDQFIETRKKEPEDFLPLSEEKMRIFFENELKPIQKNYKQMITALNIGIFDLELGIKAGKAWKKAGGDILELNVHGNWQLVQKEGYLKGMALPEYQERLKKWSKKIVAENIPLFIKFNSNIEVNFEKLIQRLSDIGIWGYHFNIKGNKKEPNFDFAERMCKQIDEIIVYSGSIRTPKEINILFDMGIDSVGFAQPVLKDSKYILKIGQKIK